MRPWGVAIGNVVLAMRARWPDPVDCTFPAMGEISAGPDRAGRRIVDGGRLTLRACVAGGLGCPRRYGRCVPNVTGARKRSRTPWRHRGRACAQLGLLAAPVDAKARGA